MHLMPINIINTLKIHVLNFTLIKNTISANVYYVPYLINTNHEENEIIENV